MEENPEMKHSDRLRQTRGECNKTEQKHQKKWDGKENDRTQNRMKGIEQNTVK